MPTLTVLGGCRTVLPNAMLFVEEERRTGLTRWIPGAFLDEKAAAEVIAHSARKDLQAILILFLEYAIIWSKCEDGVRIEIRCKKIDFLIDGDEKCGGRNQNVISERSIFLVQLMDRMRRDK